MLKQRGFIDGGFVQERNGGDLYTIARVAADVGVTIKSVDIFQPSLEVTLPLTKFLKEWLPSQRKPTVEFFPAEYAPKSDKMAAAFLQQIEIDTVFAMLYEHAEDNIDPRLAFYSEPRHVRAKESIPKGGLKLFPFTTKSKIQTSADWMKRNKRISTNDVEPTDVCVICSGQKYFLDTPGCRTYVGDEVDSKVAMVPFWHILSNRSNRTSKLEDANIIIEAKAFGGVDAFVVPMMTNSAAIAAGTHLLWFVPQTVQEPSVRELHSHLMPTADEESDVQEPASKAPRVEIVAKSTTVAKAKAKVAKPTAVTKTKRAQKTPAAKGRGK